MKEQCFPPVSWFLQGNQDLASSRLQGYLIHDELRRLGLPSRLFLAPPVVLKQLPWRRESLPAVADLVRSPVAVLQKLAGRQVGRLVSLLRERGVRTVYAECDLQRDHSVHEMCDHVVVPSRFLLEMYQQRGVPCTLIPDPIEEVEDRRDVESRSSSRRDRTKLRLVWVGHPGHWPTVVRLREILARPSLRSFELVTISTHDEADFRWRRESVRKHLLSGDIGVVPTGNDEADLAKSHNRASLFMALGIPVVTGRIPAYEDLIEHGETGLLADTDAEWEAALLDLKDPISRHSIAAKAYDSVVPRLLPSRVASSWRDLLSSVAGREEPDGSLEVARRPSPWQASSVRCEANLYFCRVAMRRKRPVTAFNALVRACLLLPLSPSVIRGLFATLTRRYRPRGT